METMFDEETADFSEMYADGEDPLLVSDVLHKAVLEVNEIGSEAAAATGKLISRWGFKKNSLICNDITATMMAMPCCARYSPEDPIQFKVDHPFIFIILHQDAILFMGRKSIAV